MTTRSVTISADSRKVIYIAADGNDGNSGLSSGAPVRTIGRANQLLGNDSELLFKAGQTYTMDTSVRLSYNNMLVGSYGQGSMPRLNWDTSKGDTVIGLGWTSNSITVQGLSFDTPARAGSTDEFGAFALGAVGQNITFRNNEILNMGYAVQGNGHPTGVLVQDNTSPLATGLRGYFVWGEGSDYVILGNTVANSTREHIVRVTRMTRLLIAQNNFANVDRSGIDGQDYNKSTLSIDDSLDVYLANNKLTGGPVRFGPLALGGTANEVQPMTGLLNKNVRADTAVAEGNQLFDTWFQITHGSDNLMFRNNVVQANNSNAFQIDGYNSEFQRQPENIQVLNNTVIDNGTVGQFMRILGHDNPAITLQNNLFVAPNLATGGGGAVIYVNDSSLSAFKTINNNVWATPSTSWYAEGGYFYVWPSWSDQRGFLTPQEWNSQPQVGDDYFQDVTLDGRFTPAAGSMADGHGAAVAGVFSDMYNTNRPTSGSWTDGAVQV